MGVAKRTKPSVLLAGLKCVVINLAEREDRFIGVQKSTTKNAPWLKLERLDAVDGRVAPPPAKDVSKKYSTLRLAKLFSLVPSQVDSDVWRRAWLLRFSFECVEEVCSRQSAPYCP